MDPKRRRHDKFELRLTQSCLPVLESGLASRPIGWILEMGDIASNDENFCLRPELFSKVSQLSSLPESYRV